MASKRHLRRKQCEGKNRFLTETDAAAACFDGMHYYLCNFCGKYHIGHKPVRMKLNRDFMEKP